MEYVLLTEQARHSIDVIIVRAIKYLAQKEDNNNNTLLQFSSAGMEYVAIPTGVVYSDLLQQEIRHYIDENMEKYIIESGINTRMHTARVTYIRPVGENYEPEYGAYTPLQVEIGVAFGYVPTNMERMDRVLTNIFERAIKAATFNDRFDPITTESIRFDTEEERDEFVNLFSIMIREKLHKCDLVGALKQFRQVDVKLFDGTKGMPENDLCINLHIDFKLNTNNSSGSPKPVFEYSAILNNKGE